MSEAAFFLVAAHIFRNVHFGVIAIMSIPLMKFLLYLTVLQLDTALTNIVIISLQCLLEQ